MVAIKNKYQIHVLRCCLCRVVIAESFYPLPDLRGLHCNWCMEDIGLVIDYLKITHIPKGRLDTQKQERGLKQDLMIRSINYRHNLWYIFERFLDDIETITE